MKSGSFLPLLMSFEIWPTWFKVKPLNHPNDTIYWGASVNWVVFDAVTVKEDEQDVFLEKKHQPHLGVTLENLYWCLQTRSESEHLKRSNKRGCWHTPIRLLFFTLPFCFLFTVKGMHQRTGWCHPSHRIILHASVWSSKAPLLSHP